jgi:hypothetical protein
LITLTIQWCVQRLSTLKPAALSSMPYLFTWTEAAPKQPEYRKLTPDECHPDVIV